MSPPRKFEVVRLQVGQEVTTILSQRQIAEKILESIKDKPDDAKVWVNSHTFMTAEVYREALRKFIDRHPE